MPIIGIWLRIVIHNLNFLNLLPVVLKLGNTVYEYVQPNTIVTAASFDLVKFDLFLFL